MSGKEASNNEDTEENVTIVQEVKKADKIKVLAEIELNESDIEEEEPKLRAETSNANFEFGKNTAINVHIDLKSYKCTECNKSFQKNESLEQHMEGAHLKFKLLQCNDCEDFFRTKKNFEKHMVDVHPNIQPFECNICKASFSIKKHFNKHMARRHQSLSFKCKNCPYFSSGSKKSLGRHQRNCSYDKILK